MAARVASPIVADLKQETDPEEVGLDSARLDRIDRVLARYVDDGRLPGWLTLIARHGRIAHLSTYGQRDLERGLPVETDTVWRMYSMTKPITSVAAMMLAEEGAFELNDPVAKLIPSFADMRVYRAGSATNPLTVPATEPIRVWHLLTHTAGLTYGFHYAHPVDALYRQAGFDMGTPPGHDLVTVCDMWAELPLLFEPGSEWNYSHATDVLGRVVEVASGQSLDEFFRTRIFQPLGMTDTAFWVSPDREDRLAALYNPHPVDRHAVLAPGTGQVLHQPSCLSGGGGLAGSAGDYHRFASMLAGKGQLDGVRLLSPRTVEYMTRNHLPANQDLETFGRALFAETPYRGVGFGLGFSVTIDPVAAKVPGSIGDYGWGGAASTAFWVDPVQDLTVMFLTQLLPSSTHPVRSQLKALVSQAIVD